MSLLLVIPSAKSEENASVPAKKNLFARGFDSVKNGTVNSVVFVKDGVVSVYDKTTGAFERFTPNFILSARDSVRNVIASYPLTAVALTAFVAVKAQEYVEPFLSDEENDEDDSF